MPKKVISKRKARSKASFLNNLPYESGFHFYTAVGNCTGITATNLSEFAAKLQVVPVESVDFHFQRQDFQKWIAETIGDKELAERISLFGAAHSAGDLRKEMLRITEERITELTGLTITNELAQIGTTVPLPL